MKNYNLILIEKQNALSGGKTNKYEYLIREEIFPSNRREIIEQAKFAYSPLGRKANRKTS